MKYYLYVYNTDCTTNPIFFIKIATKRKNYVFKATRLDEIVQLHSKSNDLQYFNHAKMSTQLFPSSLKLIQQDFVKKCDEEYNLQYFKVDYDSIQTQCETLNTKIYLLFNDNDSYNDMLIGFNHKNKK